MKTYLHYTGSKLYPKQVFIKEAEIFGVNRCLPMRIIKSLSWGDKILLATFIPKEIKELLFCPKCKTGLIYKELDPIKKTKLFCPSCNIYVSCVESFRIKEDGRKNKKDGEAEVFGYFVITGMNLIASIEFKTALHNKLDIVETKQVNQKVNRQCGSYTVQSTSIVRDTIKEIIEKAELLLKSPDFQNEKIKFFVAGRFYPLTLTIEPINFTRTVIPIEITEELTSGDIIDNKVLGTLVDYDKRAYIKKYEKRGRPKKEKK